MKERDNKRILMFVLLNILLLIYSFTTVLSKFAAEAETFSLSFFMYYGAVLGLLFVYAIVWQQIIKFLPLTTAYANRAIVAAIPPAEVRLALHRVSPSTISETSIIAHSTSP